MDLNELKIGVCKKIKKVSVGGKGRHWRHSFFRVPTRSGNREKVGNIVIGRENVGKNETPLKMWGKSLIVVPWSRP